MRAQARDVEPYETDALSAYLAQIGATPLLNAEEEIELGKRIEAGVYARYLIEEEPGHPDRADLELVVADGQAARDHMIRANLRLVVSVAKKYAQAGQSLPDMIQDGNLGLIQAVERFDYNRGCRFSTCATWWIRKAIQRGFETSKVVRIPADVREKLARLARAEQAVAAVLGRDPAEHEVAKELGEPVAKVAALRRLAWEFAGLDAPSRGDRWETALCELEEESAGAQPERAMEQHDLADALRCASAALAPRQALIIRLRFGVDGAAEHTPEQVADRVGIPRQWLRRLERDSFARMRRHNNGRTLGVWAG